MFNEKIGEKLQHFKSSFELHSNIIEWNFQNNCKFLKKTYQQIKQNTFSVDSVLEFLNSLIHRKKKSHLNLREKTYFFLMISSFEIFDNISFLDFGNEKWLILSEFFPFIAFHALKFEFFSILDCSLTKKWSYELDNSLLNILKRNNVMPMIISTRNVTTKIKWTKIALEMSKECEKISCFKSSLQCKERWWNHLNPMINKKTFSLQEDILLLKNALISGTKWAQVSKNMDGRNQHQIKNRFIYLIKEINQISREKIRSLIKANNVHLLTELSLNYLEETSNLLSFIKTEDMKQQTQYPISPTNEMPPFHFPKIESYQKIQPYEMAMPTMPIEPQPHFIELQQPEWEYVEEEIKF